MPSPESEREGKAGAARERVSNSVVGWRVGGVRCEVLPVGL